MRAPRPDGADRISGVSKSPLSASAVGFGSGIAILLLVGLLLRLFLAYVLLPGSGFASDIGTFIAWAANLAQSGPGGFYANGQFADYPPGYLYVLWLIGGLGHILAPLAGGDADSAISALIKIPPIVADIAIGYVLYRLVRSWRGMRPDAERLGLIAAGIYVFNPVTWYDSAIWGQTDSIGTLVVLLSVAALIRGNAEGASILAILAALIKPQFGVVALPVVGIVLLRRHLLRPGTMPQHEVLMPRAIRGWFEHERGVWRLLSSAVAALIVLIALLLPFSLDIPGFLRQMAETAGGYPYLSVNAYNPWSLLGAGGSSPLAFGGGWSSDTVGLLGPLPGLLIGAVLLALGFLLGVVRLAWLDDRRSIIVVTLLLALGFFMLPTRVHERYMFPIFAFLPLLAAVSRRWMIATVVLSIAAFINMHGILTTPLYATPNLVGLPLGTLFREPVAIVASVALDVAGFIFICWMLRPSAAREPDPYEQRLTGAVRHELRAGDADQERARLPSEAWWAPLSALLPRRSIRRDRSALLAGERGAKLDRRDLGLVVLVFIAALFLRTYRLEVPYGMHFDEVYHARTAMEFLQDWRYGMPHSIYEFTHPHVAKYGMAIGIELLGDHRVTSTAELGVPVSAAIIEQRWSPTEQPDARFGDRLYVATGSEVRAYDLEAPGPALVDAISGPYTSVAVDPATHILYLGAANGTIGQIPTSGFDELRLSHATPDSTGLSAAPFGSMTSMSGALTRLSVIGGHLVGLSAGGTMISIDPLTGSETGRVQLGPVNDFVSAPARTEVTVDPKAVTDRPALASNLAGLLNLDANQIESSIASAKGPVAVAGYLGSNKDSVQTQIDAGQLPGVSIADGTAVAIATRAGVSLVDSASLGRLADVTTAGGVTGLALAERGPDQPTLYGASGNHLVTIRLAPDQSASINDTIPMPNNVQKVFWDSATTNVHVLGTTQDGSSPTVYVVEPRGNSVFADAPLPFAPQAVVMDSQQDRPAEDRNDLLAMSPAGGLATVDTGNNQFAYRFPGVLLGALTAALIYLLARFLFRRRSVALIASLLVLADGMFFTNARIAMNDTYVAFFIVGAFTLFMPIWMGRWRNRWAVGGGLLTVGVLLGLALASKWVGAYAIGAVGLLILLRSALGRWIALAAMIVMTGVLGYIAITPNASVTNPQINYLFLALMVVLTVLLAIGITVRPMRMSRDEFRFAVGAPLLLGVIAAAYGILRIVTGPPPAAGALLPPVRVLEIGILGIVVGAGVAGLGWYLARRGRGPLAAVQSEPPDSVVEPESPPAPRGWLRPGSGFLGLPWILALLAITLVPLGVYVVSYIPWIDLGNQWFAGFPAGHTGQTFLDLQKSMYEYHNNLRATHPAQSPWWAWPLDLKPVWFEQNDYAGGTTAVIYDTGNIVAFWLSIPAVAWACWEAWKRRSLQLTFIVIAVMCMWLPWARIDRATFQYHIFTTLPFSFLALAYLLAELWHGPSPRTWMLAKAGAALAIIGAPLLWLFRVPLCGVANTQQVNKGAEVCSSLSRNFELTDFQLIGVVLAIVGLVAAGVIFFRAMRGSSSMSGGARPLYLPICFSLALLGAVLIVVGAGIPGTPVFQSTVTAEMPAIVALLLLCMPAYFVLQGTDPRRYVVGVLAAAVVWFVAFYPNIASLPVPTPLSQIHLGFLPTWNWGFQFGLNLDEPNYNPLDMTSIAVLTLVLLGLVVAAIYAVRNWHGIRRGEGEEVSPLPETS